MRRPHTLRTKKPVLGQLSKVLKLSKDRRGRHSKKTHTGSDSEKMQQLSFGGAGRQHTSTDSRGGEDASTWKAGLRAQTADQAPGHAGTLGEGARIGASSAPPPAAGVRPRPQRSQKERRALLVTL